MSGPALQGPGEEHSRHRSSKCKRQKCAWGWGRSRRRRRLSGWGRIARGDGKQRKSRKERLERQAESDHVWPSLESWRKGEEERAQAQMKIRKEHIYKPGYLSCAGEWIWVEWVGLGSSRSSGRAAGWGSRAHKL